MYTILALLVAAAAAIPSTENKCHRTTQHNAKFDNLPTIPDGGPADLSHVPVGYEGLAWPAWDVASRGPESQFQAFSPKNTAVYTALTKVVDRAPTPQFTTSYKGSKAIAFDLKSLAFGCGLESAGSVDLASNCTAKLTGLRADGRVVRTTLKFAFRESLKHVKPKFFVLPSSFSGLKHVNWTLIAPRGANTTEAVSVDNVNYSLLSAC